MKKVKTSINAPALSKINWTAIAIAAINVAVVSGAVPAEYEAPLITIANTLGPALIVIFRTWHTEPKA